MDGNSPQKKISPTPPAPGNAIPAPGGAIPAPGGSSPTPAKKVPSPGNAVPAPGAAIPAPGTAVPTPKPAAPGTAIPTPGTAVPAPGLSAPGAAIPTPGTAVPTPKPAAPGTSIPTPGTAVPAPGSVAPGAAIPAPGTAAPAPGSVAPGAAIPAPGTAAPAPGSVAPGAAVPASGSAAPGTAVPTPGSAAPATQTRPSIPDAEKRQRSDEAGNVKKPLPLRVRLAQPITRKQWAMTLGITFVAALLAAVVAVVIVKLLMNTQWLQDFIMEYPGKYNNPVAAPEGIPIWLSWQHFLNMFFMILIIRTGIQINQTRRPKGFWTSKRGGKKISLTLWIHLALDLLWVLNGAVFIILLFATGQWMRVVPTSWDVFPNALSAGLQYLSLDWPTENGWANYNSLQELTYFFTIFIAAPLSILSGFRMSNYWPKNNKPLNKVVPIEFARALHMPIMIYYIIFACIHVFLVFATGALRNLNHMYAGQDVENWTGFWWLVASLFVIAAGLLAIRPTLIAPVAKLFGQVTAR